MSEALIELLFWIVVFVALFLGLRKLQSRKKAREEIRKASDMTVERGAGTRKDGDDGQ